MKNKNNRFGFTLLEIIITLGIMVLTVAAISRLYSTYLRLTSDEKFKITAASLANQKIEIIRNLPYQKIGTLGGIPAGSIPPVEIVERNGYNYTVKTDILYVDDPFDGTYEVGEVNNPYRIDNPEVIFYWNLDSVANNQAPQKGAGLITTPASLTTSYGVFGNSGYFNPGNQTDYAKFDIDSNILTTKGRIGFWYRATNKNISSDRYLFYLAGCNGEFSVKRKNSNKLELRYGQTPAAEYLATKPQKWDEGKWYFIEVVWDTDNGQVLLFVNNEEIGFRSNETINPPLNCTSAYIGNNGPFGTQNADGAIDELYILNNPFPGNLAGDILNFDYKRVKITVSWDSPYGQKETFLMTDVAPKGIETTKGGGTLIINSYDSQGLPVPQANVHIVNQTLESPVDLELTTDNNGILTIPGAPVSSDYQITVTKPGFSTDQTYLPTDDFPTPIRPPVVVIEGKSTEVSFNIDKLSTLNIKTVSRSLPGNWEMHHGPTTTPYLYGKIIASGDKFFNVWEDYRDGINPRTYGQIYTFNGVAQWANDLAISLATNQLYPDITLDENENIYTTWYSNYSGNYEIYLNKHAVDGTDIWNTQKKAAQNTGSQKIKSQIIYADNKIYLTWQDNRNDQGDIYLNYLDLDGNWLPTGDIRVNNDTGSAVQSEVKIIKNNLNELIIGWLDNRNGANDIYLTKMDLTGNKIWSNEIKINNEATPVTHDNFSLATDSNNNIYIVWSDDRDGQYNIYWQKLDTDGVKLNVNDQTIITQSPSYQQINPKIAIDTNDDLFIAWQDNRSGSQDIYVQKLDTDGNNLWPQEQQINLYNNGDQTLNDITIYQETKLALAWTDWHTDQPSVWNATIPDQITENIIPNYDFTLVGSKLIYQNPDLAKFSVNLTTNSQGELSINNLEWDSYQIIDNDSFYNLLMSEPTIPFLLPAGTSTLIKLIIN